MAVCKSHNACPASLPSSRLHIADLEILEKEMYPECKIKRGAGRPALIAVPVTQHIVNRLDNYCVTLTHKSKVN